MGTLGDQLRSIAGQITGVAAKVDVLEVGTTQPPTEPPPTQPPPGTQVIPWVLGNPGRILAPSGLGPGGQWLLSITTPAAGNFIGHMSFYEYGGPPGMKHMLMSEAPNGPPVDPMWSKRDEMYPGLRYCVGHAIAGSPNYVLLKYNKTYYITCKTDVAGQTALENTIQAS